MFKAIEKSYIKHQLSAFQKFVYILGRAQIHWMAWVLWMVNKRNDAIQQSGEKQLSWLLCLVGSISL